MDRNPLIYSTDGGRTDAARSKSGRSNPADRAVAAGATNRAPVRTPAAPGGNRGPKGGAAARPAPALPDDGFVRIFRETQHRGGKTVTIVRGLPAAGLEALATELKRLCGAGGGVRDGA